MMKEIEKKYGVKTEVVSYNGPGGGWPYVEIIGDKESLKAVYEIWYCNGNVDSCDSFEDVFKEAIPVGINEAESKLNENLLGQTAKIFFNADGAVKEDITTTMALQDEMEIHEDGLTATLFGQKKIIEDVLAENGIEGTVVWMEGPSHYDFEWDVGIALADKDPNAIQRAESILNGLL